MGKNHDGQLHIVGKSCRFSAQVVILVERRGTEARLHDVGCGLAAGSAAADLLTNATKI